MSIVRIHNITSLKTWDNKFVSDPQPGDMVTFYLSPDSSGVVLEKVDENTARVLWSHFSDPFQGVVSPLPRSTIPYTKIATKAFTIQPMPVGALVFYLDEVEKRMKADE